MNKWYILCLVTLFLSGIFCPPVEEKKEEKKEGNEEENQEDVDLGLEYERYLKEVVNILETDEAFKKKLADSNETDIKSGAIAKHLDLVSHHVRSKLDELKRQEILRLQTLQRINQRIKNGVEHFDKDEMLSHLDHENPHSFEPGDLERLVKKATSDLENIDAKRKQEFKTYEMEKEHLRKEKLKQMDEMSRKKAEEEHKNAQKKHKEHPKVNHPGSKDQLEEVWEEDDHLDKDDFDPKTFFMLHDINSDGVLDEVEVEALFQNELNKVYDENNPEDDMMERYEEMNRMREHVFNEVDTNRDKQITLEEFMKSTQSKEFDKDEEWDPIDDDEVFSDKELEEFERQQQEYLDQEHAQPGEVNIPPHPDQMAGQQHPDQVQHMGQQQPERGHLPEHHQQGEPMVGDGHGQPLPPQGHGQPAPPQGHEQPAPPQAQQGHEQPAPPQGHQGQPQPPHGGDVKFEPHQGDDPNNVKQAHQPPQH